jgi:hypothetical protein
MTGSSMTGSYVLFYLISTNLPLCHPERSEGSVLPCSPLKNHSRSFAVAQDDICWMVQAEDSYYSGYFI